MPCHAPRLPPGGGGVWKPTNSEDVILALEDKVGVSSGNCSQQMVHRSIA